ncbi:MAG: hypothetical protein ABIR11_09225 [Candidatus Limnocylindrales bacterium]
MEWLGLDLRRLGTAMLAFGVVGVLIAGIMAVGLIGGAIAARNLDDRLTEDQASLVAALGRVDATMAQVVTTTGNAAATLHTTSETMDSAASVLGQVGDTAQELSTSIDINILGNRPLAGAATKFADLAIEVRGFEEHAGALAQDLSLNSVDVGHLATEIDGLRSEVRSLTARIEAFEATGEVVGLLVGGILLLGLLVAWLAVAAAFCAWAGLRLRRLATAAATTADPTPDAAAPPDGA